MIKQFWCELSEGIITLREQQKGDIIAFMNVSNAFMKVLNSIEVGGIKYIGIRFFKREVYEDLYTLSREVLR